MERLTTNKDKSEIGMYELAHNSCYYKDGSARYRDYESDIDARELTRRLLKNFADGDDSFIDDEDFDEEMLELLQYGTETIEGLIALFYRNLWAMADLRECLKEYEDLEEKRLLLRLPCKVGDMVYVNCLLGVGEAEEYKVIRVDYHSNLATNRSEFYIEALLVRDPRDSIGFYDKEIGKTVFLTKAEAKQKLKEMSEHDRK